MEKHGGIEFYSLLTERHSGIDYYQNVAIAQALL